MSWPSLRQQVPQPWAWTVGCAWHTSQHSARRERVLLSQILKSYPFWHFHRNLYLLSPEHKVYPFFPFSVPFGLKPFSPAMGPFKKKKGKEKREGGSAKVGVLFCWGFLNFSFPSRSLIWQWFQFFWLFETDIIDLFSYFCTVWTYWFFRSCIFLSIHK